MPEKNSCPAQTALEEYAAQLSSQKVQTDVKTHIKSCRRCREKVAALEREADRLRLLLLNEQTNPGEQCPESTVLAAYLDNAIKPEQRTEVERHAAICRKCQQNLKRIHKDTRDAMAEDAPQYLPASDAEPVKLAGRKKLQQTRPQRPKSKQLKALNDDGQGRKKRLSSDYD